ncbi:MAG: ABC transporter permease [Alphaproteobacteria bacterium]|nr:ABC transporter permease [Alphaproteobacteria bacterium]
MLAFVIHRILAAVPVLAFVALLVFLMLRLAPGDPAAVMAGDAATAEDIAKIRAGLGLDQPLATQLRIWIERLLHGDLGESFYFKRPVAALIAQRLEPTLALAACSTVLAVALAIPLGVLAAHRHDTLVDRAVMLFSVLGFSLPVFVIGYLLIYLLAAELGWFPVQGYARIADGLGGFAHRLALPSATLAIAYVALIARMTRASMLEVLGEDYIRTARAKGATSFAVLVHHALRNAAIPILTVIGIGVALLISGAVVTETVFGIPGLGRLTVEAVLSRDFPTVQALILLFSAAYVAINLAIDIAYGLLDPRIRY